VLCRGWFFSSVSILRSQCLPCPSAAIVLLTVMAWLSVSTQTGCRPSAVDSPLTLYHPLMSRWRAGDGSAGNSDDHGIYIFLPATAAGVMRRRPNVSKPVVRFGRKRRVATQAMQLGSLIEPSYAKAESHPLGLESLFIVDVWRWTEFRFVNRVVQVLWHRIRCSDHMFRLLATVCIRSRPDGGSCGAACCRESAA
jgi:hypothetical protein